MNGELVDKLREELTKLLPSAASDQAVRDHAPTLRTLAVSSGKTPRSIIAASVAKISEKQGRTTTRGARVNYAFTRVAEGLEILFGENSAQLGVEARYRKLGDLEGAVSTITGRRMAARFVAVLAEELAASEVSEDAEVKRAAPVLSDTTQRGIDFLRGRAETPDDLIDFARATGILLATDWQPALAHLLAELHRDDLAQPRSNPIEAMGRHNRTDPERVALASIYAEVAQLSADGALLTATRGELSRLLSSEVVSRNIAASLTPLRRRALLILGLLGDPRPGVGVGDGLPEHLFVPLSTQSLEEGGSVLISRFPVTQSQYSAVLPGKTFPRLGETLPAVGVNVADCINYCSAVEQSLRVGGSASVLMPSGNIANIDLPESLGVGLPSLHEIQTASGFPDRKFPWSKSLEDNVGIARRLAYNSLQPVGMFPDERGPTGALDLAGLIWQWLEDSWPTDPLSPGKMKHVFGGGFGKNIRFFEGACSLGVPEGARSGDRGFRIVVRWRQD